MPVLAPIVFFLQMMVTDGDRTADRVRRVASNDYIAAIEAAPVGPETRDELYRICRRESWCGRYGKWDHSVDSWTGVPSYVSAVARHRLDPEQCPSHRLDNYQLVAAHAAAQGREELSEALLELPLGTHTPHDFATRGAYGMNASRALRFVGTCADPDDLDVAALATRAAIGTLSACKRKGQPCTCADHTALWVGRGTFEGRPLFGPSGKKSRYSSVVIQCGRWSAIDYAVAEIWLTFVNLLTE